MYLTYKASGSKVSSTFRMSIHFALEFISQNSHRVTSVLSTIVTHMLEMCSSRAWGLGQASQFQ